MLKGPVAVNIYHSESGDSNYENRYQSDGPKIQDQHISTLPSTLDK